MGYQRSVLRVEFDEGYEPDPSLAGLVVRARRLTIDDVLTMSKLTTFDTLPLERKREMVGEVVEILWRALLSWNLEDDAGAPVPLTQETIRAQDWSMLENIAIGIMHAAAGVAPPLPERSNGGVSSVEASIPMEPSSPDPPS